MERYLDDQEEIARTRKNQDLYEDIYNSLPSSNVAVLDNESEIDISKLKELSQNREGYKRVRQYQSILETDTTNDDQEEYDIYEDIDNKVYDINMILEDAKSKRGTSERERYRNLRNTQYDILSKLNLNEQPEIEEMSTDFFTQDKTMKELVASICNNSLEDDTVESKSKTAVDLFEDLKGGENTILTEAITNTETVKVTTEEENTFYTDRLNFTKDDFDGFQNLQTNVKKNNKLMKVLISILTIILVAIALIITFTIL